MMLAKMMSVMALVTVIVVPHGDDEITLLPYALQTGATIVVLTNGAGTGWCKPVNGGPGQYTPECEQMRRTSTEGFLGDVAPSLHLRWMGFTDGSLSLPAATATIDWFCAPNHRTRHFWFEWGNTPPECDLWAAGAGPAQGYLHPDHLMTQEAVLSDGGHVWSGETYWDPDVFAAMRTYYGWLLNENQWPLVGLAVPASFTP
jgi:hypothetical protein